ncbi:MAG: Ni/Fe-hydrogenase, b-type cytochrome subunit [Helicobacteraceae bacterium]|jgi:Ni/Fe-hydrogenase 1 B-type cytochrome subunit|nr:Ni/Fe-hydrogenase, b-type cytochrome subunit [Helicobacteraceae bacterium]
MAKEEVIEVREVEVEFSAVTRALHWIRFFTIAALTFTGFYLGAVFIMPSTSGAPVLFLNARMRMWHEIFGFVLIAITLFKVYYFFVSRNKAEKLERGSFSDALSPKKWLAQLKYYLLIGKHPHLKGVYNPLQFVAYSGLYIVFFLLCLTGLILYAHSYHDGLGGLIYEAIRPFEVMLGGLANVRVLHHVLMWVLLVFLPVHVYMVVFNSLKGKEGALDSILSGIKFRKKH